MSENYRALPPKPAGSDHNGLIRTYDDKFGLAPFRELLNLVMQPPPVSPCFRSRIRVYYFDTDSAGVVNNIAYLRMIEIARTELAEHLGWTLSEMSSSGRVPVVARTEIDYLKPARLGDELVIHSALTALERVRFRITFTLTRGSDEHLIARCQQTMVTVQLPGGRPQGVPEDWRKAYPDLIVERPSQS